jgi:hypothetical protein
MMTLKLVSNGGRVRLIEAASFTITEEKFEIPGYCRKICAHDLAIGVDDCWWVGNPPYEVAEYRVFDVAYVMNSHGRTVETLQRPLDLCQPRQSDALTSDLRPRRRLA